jgi:hypothetical protein
MAKEVEQRGSAGPRAAGQEDPESLARAAILERVSEVRILELSLARELIRRRQELGLDKYDEMWDGVYVMPPLANNPHQTLVSLLLSVLHAVIMLPGRGLVLPGANVSDRRHKWGGELPRPRHGGGPAERSRHRLRDALVRRPRFPDRDPEPG